MELKKGFEKFIDKISLNQTRIDNLISAHNTLRDILKSDEEVKKYFLESFLQGSYALHTAIKPLTDGEYDVDIILSLNLKNEGEFIEIAHYIVNWLHGRINSYKSYNNKCEAKTKCVRIAYSADLRLDITPVHSDEKGSDELFIPPYWDETNPRGFKAWCRKTHEQSHEKFYSIVRILKYWRDLQFGYGSHPKSILLTTLIGKYIDKTEENSLHKSLMITCKRLNDYLQGLDDIPEITNPSLTSEIISRSWSYSDFIDFKTKFKNFTDKINSSFSEETEAKTIETLNSDSVFNGNFPKELFEKIIKEAKLMGDAMREGSLGIDKTGKIGINLPQKVADVKPTKFYGDNN
jgi:hypothetical protein